MKLNMYENLEMFSKIMSMGQGVIGILSHLQAENIILIPTPSPQRLRARCPTQVESLRG